MPPEHPKHPIIDAHHHVWDLAVRDQPWTAELPALRRTFTFDELRPQLEASGVAGTVVVQTITVPEETPELLALAAATPEIRGVVGWTDLTAPDIADRLAELTALPGGTRLVAIRHQVQEEPDPDWLRRADVVRGLRAVAQAGLAYDLLVTASQLPAAIQAVRTVPELRFVLDHGGKPEVAAGRLDPWASDIRELAQLPNAAVKLSGLLTEAGPDWTTATLAPYSDQLLDAFGPPRVMAGSDWPVCTVRASYGEVMQTTRTLLAGLDTFEQSQVLGGTAARWYGID